MSTPKRSESKYAAQNANTGALYFEQEQSMLDSTVSGVWEDSRNRRFKLAISADVEGVRTIVVLTNDEGKPHQKGTVSAVARKVGSKQPAYRGTIGRIKIVLWDKDRDGKPLAFYQVRPDKRVASKPTVSDEALELLGIAPAAPADTVFDDVSDDDAPF